MKTTLNMNAPLDTLDRTELKAELAVQTQESYQQLARGVKYLRFGPIATTIASNAFSLDGSGAPGGSLGPCEGFMWSVRRLVITGLGTGTSPDVVNIYRGNPAGIPVWQLNGNSFGTTFGKGELVLLGGEVLSFANSGTIAATGQVTFSGDLVEVPAEEFFKIV